MNVSRVVICLVATSFLTKSISGQQGSVASPTTLSSPTANVTTMPALKPKLSVAPSPFTVLVFNFRQVSGGILSNAEKEADEIFDHAGIKVVWQECPTGTEPCRTGSGLVFLLAFKAGPVQ